MDQNSVFYTLKKDDLYLSVTYHQEHGEPWTHKINHAMFYNRLDMVSAAQTHMGGEIVMVRIEEVSEVPVGAQTSVDGKGCVCRQGWG